MNDLDNAIKKLQDIQARKNEINAKIDALRQVMLDSRFDTVELNMRLRSLDEELKEALDSIATLTLASTKPAQTNANVTYPSLFLRIV